MVLINKPRKLTVTKFIMPTIAEVNECIQQELTEMNDDIWDIKIQPTDIKYFGDLT
jgi:hypothetical protein